MKSTPRTNPASKLCLAFLLLLTAIPSVAASHEFQAGAGWSDITPPPGLPTGGYTSSINRADRLTPQEMVFAPTSPPGVRLGLQAVNF